MNRIKYASSLLLDGESTLACEKNVRLYDGDQKTQYECGELIITTHRLLWGRPGVIAKGMVCLTLQLSLIVFIEEESPGTFNFSRSRKVVLYLSDLPCDNNENGPQFTSLYNFIKLSFRDGYSTNVMALLHNALANKAWELPNSEASITETSSTPNVQHKIKLRTGIVGIERNVQERQKATDESIVVAFQDLNKLMSMAKDMVNVSRNISSKIKEKKGDITEDETIRFKSYLLSLGIDDPVIRDSYKSNSQYYKSLAKEICNILKQPISEMGGMMALTDVFCRVNRARGLELLSPDDILNACQLMESLGLDLKLFQFQSGVMVLQLSSLDTAAVIEATMALVEEKTSLTCDELAQCLGVSLTLAKERLLTAEKFGKCCRDDSIEGLRFYPNLFLTKEE